MKSRDSYILPATERIPNSPLPLLHYKKALDHNPQSPAVAAVAAYDVMKQNKWDIQWLVQYGYTQRSHYHSRTHEAMAVLSGNATIRFGVADTSENDEDHTTGLMWEEGGIELQAEVGDVFIIPAGVAHKTYDCKPQRPFKRLTQGDGTRIESDDPRGFLAGVEADGFTMLGAYPEGGVHDFVTEADDGPAAQRVAWSVPCPDTDPILGESQDGLRGVWGRVALERVAK
ncbi:hypothetical protein HII31_13477 [Pseudocercospora fuligena]|uniref:Cupin type-1 domain-containing protein n=1 Tax=Pseudocercospora fuligena TaxID=685502 RepID=A0A8H6VC43_9PEZI|nr:hypothetical protein HII31_13477 [Pseudocercospora fuligena]